MIIRPVTSGGSTPFESYLAIFAFISNKNILKNPSDENNLAENKFHKKIIGNLLNR